MSFLQRVIFRNEKWITIRNQIHRYRPTPIKKQNYSSSPKIPDDNDDYYILAGLGLCVIVFINCKGGPNDGITPV